MQTLAELPFVADNPALDFVNTAEKRGDPLAGDVLRTPDDLRTWGVRYGILDPDATSEDPERELGRAITARELLYRIWSDRVDGAEDDPECLHQLSALAAEAIDAARLRGEGGLLRWAWPDGDLASVRHVAVTAAVELLTHAGTSRLKQCPGEHCGWFFLDTTKRGNRRWCSMSECGQIAKNAGRRRRGAAHSTSEKDRQ